MNKNNCELCKSNIDIIDYQVKPREETISICSSCNNEINKKDLDETYWHCLNDSMWRDVESVHVVVYRLLKRLKNQDLLDMLYIDDDTKKWANIEMSEMSGANQDSNIVHKDANGMILKNGDSASITKDLVVKGANFTAKRGVLVKNISLVLDDEEHIEARVNGSKIFIKTCFLKKV